jgi:hypothetical protein
MKIIDRLLAISLILIGILFAGTALNALYLGNISKSWPTTNATIIANSITSAESARSSSNFNLNLRYAYNVGGKSYEGSKVSYPDRTSYSKADMDVLSKQFPVGTIHPVSYAPHAPDVVCLRPGANYGFVILFLLFGAGWSYPGLRMLKKQPFRPAKEVK